MPTPPAPLQVLPTALRGAFQSCGQNCAGAERFIVQEKVFDEFVRWVGQCGGMARIHGVHGSTHGSAHASMHADQSQMVSTASTLNTLQPAPSLPARPQACGGDDRGAAPGRCQRGGDG